MPWSIGSVRPSTSVDTATRREQVDAYLHSTLFKHVWILVPCCTQASVSTLCFKHVWIMVPCLCTSISLQPFDQTLLDCGSLLCTSISLHPVFQTRLDCGSLSAYTHLCFEPKWLRLTWIIPCKCLVFRVVGMVMGTSTVA